MALGNTHQIEPRPCTSCIFATNTGMHILHRQARRAPSPACGHPHRSRWVPEAHAPPSGCLHLLFAGVSLINH